MRVRRSKTGIPTDLEWLAAQVMQPKSTNPLKRLPTWVSLSIGIFIGLIVANIFTSNVRPCFTLFLSSIYPHSELTYLSVSSYYTLWLCFELASLTSLGYRS